MAGSRAIAVSGHMYLLRREADSGEGSRTRQSIFPAPPSKHVDSPIGDVCNTGPKNDDYSPKRPTSSVTFGACWSAVIRRGPRRSCALCVSPDDRCRLSGASPCAGPMSISAHVRSGFWQGSASQSMIPTVRDLIFPLQEHRRVRSPMPRPAVATVGAGASASRSPRAACRH
jgi:hypothetical protein